jgi:tyrosyl-tRNA synthetase
MDLEEGFDLACRGTVEVIQRSELRDVLSTKQKPRAYWGFECSGKRDTSRLD